jgi:hypothetical protein
MTKENKIHGWLCMMCCKEAHDGFEVEANGEIWVYCEPCDCWTAHPPEKEEDK